MRVALIGWSGFIGSACAAAMRQEGLSVVQVDAPRCSSSASDVDAIVALATSTSRSIMLGLERALRGCEVVVNAAGIATPGGKVSRELLGANAVLPADALIASANAGARRYIHISSAAVQGRRRLLTESLHFAPFSPYSHSKALAEKSLRRLASKLDIEVTALRPTSVHGQGRSATYRVAKLARSRLSVVAGDGGRPTPQVHVANVAAAVTFLVRSGVPLPPVVLQPWEGFTCRSFLETLGLGRLARTVPDPVARALVNAAYATRRPGVAMSARRLEMLLLGQGQEDGWLADHGFKVPVKTEGWLNLAEHCLQETRVMASR